MWRPIHVVATGIELVGLPWINNFSNLIVHQSLRELSGEPNIQPCALSEENYLAIGEYLLTRHMSNVFEYHQYTSKTYVPKEEDLKRINGDRDLEAAVIEYQNRHSCLSGLIDSYG
jgi:hypothetical protein